MKELLKRLLSRWPVLYKLAAKVYANLRFSLLLEYIIGTKAREREWAIRHLKKGNDWGNIKHSGAENEWVLGYWDSREHSHRALLQKKIAELSPISSVLEIGCNCGPNLYLIARRFPDIKIQGIDINPIAIDKGKELLAAEGITNVNLSIVKADELGDFPDKSFDVVFTDAVLIYVGRDKIKQVLKEMVRITNKGMILLEHQCSGFGNGDRLTLGIRHNGLWQRDYEALLKLITPESTIQITKVTEDIWPDKEWQETGAIIKVRLPK
ncbi:class I SAM-dependent methyltransferase [Chloroflexota bacterium]